MVADLPKRKDKCELDEQNHPTADGKESYKNWSWQIRILAILYTTLQSKGRIGVGNVFPKREIWQDSTLGHRVGDE